MSGHSKWSQIKRKKGAKDQERGKLFSKLSRAITLAVLEGGGVSDPVKNTKLRLTIAQAKAFNMPKDNIIRAIEKAKKPEGQNLKEVVYEGFAGVAMFMIIAATDNPKRTFVEVRTTLEKHGGKLGGVNSVAHLFDKCGRLVFEKNQMSENQILDFAAAISAHDVAEDKDSFIIYIPFEKLGRVEDALQGLSPSAVNVCYRPKSSVIIDNQGAAQRILDLIEALDNLDDVHGVFTNADISDDLMSRHEKI